MGIRLYRQLAAAAGNYVYVCDIPYKSALPSVRSGRQILQTAATSALFLTFHFNLCPSMMNFERLGPIELTMTVCLTVLLGCR